MSFRNHDEVADVLSRATLQARLELVSEELERAVERLSTLIAEIKAEENGGDSDDGGGAAPEAH